MAASLNLQRNTKVFYSTVDINGGAAGTAICPANTWQIEVLAGYAFSQAAATQDITSLESGLTPDRSQQRFNTAINPVDWNFQTYLKPTRATSPLGTTTGNLLENGNVTPVADWFLWQALLSATAPASSLQAQSSWQGTGDTDSAKWQNTNRVASANVAAANPNFATATEAHLYLKVDNVVYQLANAAVNQASIDAAIDGIATTTWTGFATNLVELTGAPRNVAINVFGGILNNGTTVAAASSATIYDDHAGGTLGDPITGNYHPWNTYNVAGASTSAEFIKNRLSTIDITDTSSGDTASHTFPVTGMTLDINNNITYLTPEELASLNSPITQFTGVQTISGSISAYLRSGASASDNSATFLRNIVSNTATQTAQGASANLIIGGATAPYFAIDMQAVQFGFPTHAIEDVVGITAEFLAQETTAEKGLGASVTIFTKAA